MRKILVPVPPLEFQERFTRIVKKVEILKDKKELSLQELEHLYMSLRQKFFSDESVLVKQRDISIESIGG